MDECRPDHANCEHVESRGLKLYRIGLEFETLLEREVGCGHKATKNVDLAVDRNQLWRADVRRQVDSSIRPNLKIWEVLRFSTASAYVVLMVVEICLKKVIVYDAVPVLECSLSR